MSDRDLCFTPATELQRLYRTGKTSPLEVMQAVLARVDVVNPKLNAIVTLARESALREARTATAALKRKGKKVGAWGFGNEAELYAGLYKAGIDPT